MTNPNKTLIGVLVDRSASMYSMREEMDQALRTFLNGQRDLPGKCEVTLAQFDNHYELVYSPRDIHEIPEFSIRPRGSTALLDAMGRFITDIGSTLRRQPERDRPGKVLIVIITDGEENSSREWRKHNVTSLVTDQMQTYSWDFVFLGAGIDAVEVGADLGISRGSSITFDVANASVAMAAAGNYASTYRTMGSAAFTEDDRKGAVGGS